MQAGQQGPIRSERVVRCLGTLDQQGLASTTTRRPKNMAKEIKILTISYVHVRLSLVPFIEAKFLRSKI